MSHAVIAWGRFNPPTEEGHGKLVKAVQDHAEKVGGTHYIFPTHTQDKKKNPMTHEDKVHAMRSLFPTANVVSHSKVRTLIDAMKHLEKKGHKEVTVVAGSDRIPEYHKLLNTYRSKEFPGIKKVHVHSAGQRDPDAEGAEGMSASKLRGLVSSGKKKEFVSHYSDKKLGAQIHDKVKAGMQMESVTPVGIFLLGGPGSGKDYVLKNIFSRFDLTEVQSDQILNGAAAELYEGKQNIVINGALDEDKIAIIQNILEGYDFDYVHVGVTNKVSRLRNEQREQPLTESKRIEKFLKAEKLAEGYNCFNFNNSINLNESSELEKIFFASQIEKLLERVVGLGLEIKQEAEPKAFLTIKEKYFPPVKHHKSGLPSKYVKGLKPSEIAAKKAAISHNAKLSDSDPAAYKDMPGDKRVRAKGIPVSKYTKKYHAMYGEEKEPAGQKPHLTIDKIAEKHGVSPAEILKQFEMGRKVEHEHTKDPDLAADIALNHLGEIPDYYTRLASMEKQGKTANEQVSDEIVAHQEKEERKRRVRDTRVLTHQNRHLHQAAIGTHESVNTIAVNKKRELTDAERAGYERAKIMNNTPKVQEEVIDEGAADTSLSAKAAKSGISVATLRKVYNRGVAAWNSGHRPGTTPAQWGHARVNSYITKGKTYHTADKDLHEEQDINTLFEVQLIGTNEYRKHAIAMTPGQSDDIQDAFPVKDPSKKDAKTESPADCGCETGCDCKETRNESFGRGIESGVRKSFNALRSSLEEKVIDGVEEDPTLQPKRKKSQTNRPHQYDSTLQGIPVAPRFSAFEAVHPQEQPEFPIQKRSWMMAKGSKKVGPRQQTAVARHNEEVSLEEAVQYHLDNNISITENIFRPGSDMFFQLIGEAKRLYKEGKYMPADEYEQDLLNSDIGEKAMYEGQEVLLDFPFVEEINEEESDPTEGHGIGKPFRSGGGGAVYVRTGDGGVRKVNFSQSGMKKRYNEPGRVRSFVARHHCLTNKDKTSASYWACRWPRYFSDSGQTWW